MSERSGPVATQNERETRTWDVPLKLETRQLEGEEAPKRVLRGYAAVFDSLSEELWGFREIIRPGAFAKTLQEADVRALVNHDPNLLLGRSSAGTLELREDEKGLAITIIPPDTSYARDLETLVERGDLREMSFTFRAIKDRRTKPEGQDWELRELLEVALYDISPVTFPAYPATEIGVDFRKLDLALHRARAGDLVPEARDLLGALAHRLKEYAPPQLEPGEDPHSGTQSPEQDEEQRAQKGRRLASMTRRVELARRRMA